MRTLACALFALCCAVPRLLAQTGEEEGKRPPTGRLAWFVATGIPEDLENPVSVMTGKDITRVTLSRRLASEPVKIPADGVIRLVRPAPAPVEPGKPAYQTLAQARIAEGVSKALVILIPPPKPESGLVFHTRVQDLAGFKGGDTLYLNLSVVDVAVRLGAEAIELKPGSVKIHHVTGLDKPTNVAVSYHFLHPTRKEWQLLSASTLVMHPTRREICIFSWDPRFSRVDYLGITVPVSE